MREGQLQLRNKLDQTMEREGIDLWVSPAQAGSAPIGFTETGRSGITAIWTYAGMPAVTVPGAKINGMPIGFQCIGAYGSDESLLAWAIKIEAVLRAKEDG